MPCGQVTLGSGATQVLAGPQRAMQFVIQNNSAHAIRVGDSNKVSTTVPAAVNSGTAGFGQLIQSGGSNDTGTFTSGAAWLQEWYIAGTSGDVIDYQYTPED